MVSICTYRDKDKMPEARKVCDLGFCNKLSSQEYLVRFQRVVVFVGQGRLKYSIRILQWRNMRGCSDLIRWKIWTTNQFVGFRPTLKDVPY